MKLKTIVFFVLGLLGWLFATNYQSVYSKMTNFINPSNEIRVTSTTPSEAMVNSTTEAASRDNDLQSDQVSVETLDDDQNQEIEASKDTSSTEIQVASLDQELSDSSSAKSDMQTEANDSSTTMKDDVEKPAYQTSSLQNNFPHSMGYPMMNPNMMNPAMYMNPMAMMTPMMMGMMAPMMNPAMWMNPMAMMNHPINTMTETQNMNAMMMSMDPKMMFGMFGQPSKSYQDGETPEQLPVVTIPGFPTQTYQNWPKNTVSPEITREAKLNAFQTVMAMSPLSMRNMVSMMADKIPVEEGVSWDDAVESMKLRANEVNFKFVGSSPLWKEIEAVTGEPSARVEIFRFCDASVAREILDEVPEFIVFLPCRIALSEDAEGKLWVMTLDWDVAWLDYSQNTNSHLPKELREDATSIRENIRYIMEGAATGDF